MVFTFSYLRIYELYEIVARYIPFDEFKLGNNGNKDSWIEISWWNQKLLQLQMFQFQTDELASSPIVEIWKS